MMGAGADMREVYVRNGCRRPARQGIAENLQAACTEQSQPRREGTGATPGTPSGQISFADSSSRLR